MVKSIEKTESTRSQIIITAKITVPLMEYGNIVLEATQEIDIADGDALDRSIETVEGQKNLLRALAMVILPLAEAEVARAASNPDFLKHPSPDYWLRKNSPVYRWLRIAQPDLTIPAMQAIIGQMDISIPVK